MGKKKKKIASFKIPIKWSYLISILLLILLTLITSIVYIQNQGDNKLFSTIKSEFKTYSKNYKADVLEENDLAVWWISQDNLNIINDDSYGIQLNINSCQSDLESNSEFYTIANALSSQVSKILENNGFILNINNSSKSIKDTQFYDYIQAYENKNTKCVFKADPDCASLYGEKQMHYTFSFICTNNFDKNYQEQAPYLKDLGIKDAVIHVQKKVGNFVDLGVNYRRSGHELFAEFRDNKWHELWSGQDIPPCEIVNKYQIPKEIIPKCI